MSLIVACPNCQTRYNLPEKFKGKKLKCKSCGKPFAAAEGASKAKTPVNQAAPRAPGGDARGLSNMGIGQLKKQADPFATPAYNGPDPLRNHVVQDPGFGMPGGSVNAGVAGQTDDDDEGVDSEFNAVTSNPFIKTLPTTPSQRPSKQKARQLKGATFGQRFAGNFVDGIFLNIVASGGFFLVGMFAETVPILAVVIAAVTVVFLLLYYFIFEGITGRTVGKYVAGTKVVQEDGSKVSFVQVIGRTFCRLIPLEIFSFLLYDDKSRPVFWHDSIPKTRVVQA